MITSGSLPEIYPQYCFHLSPTVKRWCHLRIADIHALTAHPGFEGQDLYFHLNHPIKWVRLAGIVVAVDDFNAWRAYTIDDSSGETIECHVNIPKTGPAQPRDTNTSTDVQQKTTLSDGDLSVGDIIDIKGTIRVFRERRQIKAEKIVHLRSTQQEVDFWGKIDDLRSEILNQPWVLDSKVVRKCRREAEGYNEKQARKERRRARDEEERSAREPIWRESEKRLMPPPPTVRKLTTGLEKRPKSAKVAVQITGKYSALGL